MNPQVLIEKKNKYDLVKWIASVIIFLFSHPTGEFNDCQTKVWSASYYWAYLWWCRYDVTLIFGCNSFVSLLMVWSRLVIWLSISG